MFRLRDGAAGALGYSSPLRTPRDIRRTLCTSIFPYGGCRNNAPRSVRTAGTTRPKIYSDPILCRGTYRRKTDRNTRNRIRPLRRDTKRLRHARRSSVYVNSVARHLANLDRPLRDVCAAVGRRVNHSRLGGEFCHNRSTTNVRVIESTKVYLVEWIGKRAFSKRRAIFERV